MKIRNIFSIVATTLFILTLTSCYITDSTNKEPIQPQPTQINPNYLLKDPTIPETPAAEIKKIQKLKVAVMLPLSGKDAKMGQSMLNSINISLFDNDTDGKIELVIFDNKSSDSTSKKLIQEIADKKIKLVIGPIFTSSVEAIADIASQNNISVISFSNNSDLINKKGIFLSGFSIEQEIDRITSYLVKNGNTNFAIITENDQYGIRSTQTLRKMVEMKDGNFIASQFYINKQDNFLTLAQKTLNSYIIAKDKNDYRAELATIEDPEARKNRELEIISSRKLYADTIFITESSGKTPNIVKAIKDANKDGRSIKIIGTSRLDRDFIINNPIMEGTLFAEADNSYYNSFVEKYRKIYHEAPTKVDSIAYDVTAFVIALTNEINDEKPISATIVNFNNKKGYKGINGLFRFLPNGLIERNLVVMEIQNKSLNKVSQASTAFLKY